MKARPIRSEIGVKGMGMASTQRLRIAPNLAANLAGLGRWAVVCHLTVVSLPVLLAADVLLCSKALAQTTSTTSTASTASRIPVNALPSSPKTEYGSAIAYQASGKTATIIQSSPTNIVSWKSFDIGSAASVKISQPSSSAVLLNKVEGGAFLNKTVIDGMLNANGRVYVYNPNGIIFGKTASVNVDTLIASSLKFDESRVIGGLLLPGATPVLGTDPAYAGGVPGAVIVEGNSLGLGKLTAGTGGLILLAAPNVTNNGILNAPDGQVMLAAGSKVYLATPETSKTGTSLRGLLVEVGNLNPDGTVGPVNATTNTNATSATAATAGTATRTAENGAFGEIRVGHGNATMIGYAVNQKNIISATTSVSANGSIYLYARDQAEREGVNSPWHATRTGKLVLGPDSVTEVKVDLDDTAKIPLSTTFNKSAVKLNGENIELQKNASIVASGGDVDIKAERLYGTGETPTLINPNTDIVRVDFAPGSRIDVSGSSGTQLAMESNVITVDLRGTELADNVVLRDSPLYATKVQVDIRKGTPVANVDGWLKLVEHGIGELNAAGGSVSVSAGGAIIQRAGSKINVDGGYVDYQDGHVNTTQLKLNDKLVDIGAAAANTLYSAAVNLPDGANNFEAGYRQGSSAGSVKLSAPVLVQQGELSGQVTVGSHQRDVTASGHPTGGVLKIGNVSTETMSTVTGKKSGVADNYGFAGNLVIGGSTSSNSTAAVSPPEVGEPFDVTKTEQRLLASRLDLSADALASAGFNSVMALTMGNIDVSAPITLAPGGRLWLGAGQSLLNQNQGGDISFNASVTIPGGSLTAASSDTLRVADGVSLDVAGRWVNDRTLVSPPLDAQGNPVTPLVLNGGSLNLSARQLDIGKSVSADVSAGAWLNASSKTTQGKAGSITFQADPTDPDGAPAGAALQLGSGLNLSAYGFGSGGKLKLVGRNVSIGPDSVDSVDSGSADADDLSLQAGFFQQGGFSSYDIGANLNFDVAANTVIKPRAQSWQFNADSSKVSSGLMGAVAAPYLFGLNGPSRVRPATSLTFRALSKRLDNAGILTVNDGAQMLLDPGAGLSLLAGRQLTVMGELSAPAGNILLGLTPDAGGGPFNATRSIWFGPKAEVLAAGSTQRLYTNGDGVSSGEVLDGGTIQIGKMGTDGKLVAAEGYVVAESGSTFNVGGVGAADLRFKSSGTVTAPQDVVSSGGSIEIRAREGLLFDGTLKGGPGGNGGNGGSLTVAVGESTNGVENILTISEKAPSGGVVPGDLKPGQAIVVNLTKTVRGEDEDLGWFLTGSRPGNNARKAGEGWIMTGAFERGGFGRLNFKSPGALAFGLGKSDVSLTAIDSVVLDAPNLRADSDASRTVLSADAVGHTLTLTAPYIQMGSADTYFQNPVASSTGTATLTANATTVDLIGNSALQGFSEARLNAKEDIRLTGVNNTVGMLDADGAATVTARSQGSLAMSGNLTLTDAQTYPTTLSHFSFMVSANNTTGSTSSTGSTSKTDSTGWLKFVTNGNTPQQVLSAGGSLTAIAPHIVQDGRVVAPFGSIMLGNLDATSLSATWSEDATLASSGNNPINYGSFWLDNLRFPGDPRFAAATPDIFSKPIITSDLVFSSRSVTSVAGSGAVPFGSVANGSVPTASDWRASLSDGTLVSIVQNPVSGGSRLETELPAKSIVAHAKTIKTDRGSVQDMSGGGELYAYEFTPGKGGSKDVLSNNTPGSKTTVFAINPNFKASVAPIDGSYGSDGGLAPGDRVYLSGMADLPAGAYTLLPAHYALLPGGFSVSVAPSTRDMQPGSNAMQADGSMLVAGRLLDSGSNRSNGFIVSSGAVVRNKSEFTVYDATTYFTDKAKAASVATPERPVDGGYIGFEASGGATGKTLALNGAIKLGAASGGRAGAIDISVPDIAVVVSSGQSTGGAVELVAGDLNALGADSLVLGALRDKSENEGDGGKTNGGTHLSIGANNVTLSNNAANPLSGPEIVIAAKNSITLDSGAAVQSTGTLARPAQDLSLDGGGALLRVSSGSPVAVTRADSSSANSKLTIASGATVAASGSTNLDATGKVILNGELDLAPGSALSLGSNGISLGEDIPDTVVGLRFDSAGLDMLSKLSQLSFNSYASTIDLYGTVNLGNSAMKTLSFKGKGFQAVDRAQDPLSRLASFSADSIRFDGAQANADPAPVAEASGKLSVQANTIEMGDQAFAIQGYADTTLTAGRQMIAAGSGGQLVADNNLTLAVGRIATGSATDATFKAGGRMMLTPTSNPSGSESPAALGGQLNFVADSIVSDATILAPSGKVALRTQSGGRVDIAGGLISVAGSAVDFGSTTRYSPGGTISLNGGAVAVAAPAVLDLSAVGAAAGTLDVVASNLDGDARVQLNGAMKAHATAGIDGVLPAQGRFSLDADLLGGPFGQMNTVLNAAGFLESREFRIRNGDVQMTGSDKLTAHQVVIAVDNGNIEIGGAAVIDASGAKGGSIELYASQPTASGNAGKVTLADNARLDAHATGIATSEAGSVGNGGRVVIGTASADGLAASRVDGGGSINLKGGSIDVAGSSDSRNGSVTLRAPRLVNSNSVSGVGVPGGVVGFFDNSVSGVGVPGGVGGAGGVFDAGDAGVVGAASVAVATVATGATGATGKTVDGGVSVASGEGTVTVENNKVSDVAIASLKTDIRNSAATVIEAYQVYQGSTVSEKADSATNLDATLSGAMYSQANAFITDHKAKILQRLGVADNENLSISLRPGIEVRSLVPAGDLTVSVNEFAAAAANRGWNLADWRFDGAPTMLTLRAAGNLNILGSIGDGFVKPANTALAMPNWTLGSDASASYRLSAGADLSAAHPLAVKLNMSAEGGGDVYFGFADRTPTSAAPLKVNDAPVALVRTGTGRIDVAAGRDITLGMAKFFVNRSSDPSVDGTPVIYDSLVSNSRYKVSIYGASVYTAGQAAPADKEFNAPQNVLNVHYGAGSGKNATATGAAFGSHGGAITLRSGRDLNGPTRSGSDWSYRDGDGEAPVEYDPDYPDDPATPGTQGTLVMLPSTVPQLINNWLFRQGRSYVDADGNVVFEKLGNEVTLNTAWWSRPDYFNQGIATFGGGDISITASAGNVSNLSASVATSAYIPAKGALKEMGGGDLTVRAGGDINGGSFYVQKGVATLRADGSVAAGNAAPTTASGSATALNTVLALGDARVDVTAGRNLAVETVFNPTLTEQSVNNVEAGNAAFGPIYGVGAGGARWDVTDESSDSVAYRQKYAQFSNFSTYGADSAVSLMALGGDLLLSNDARKLAVAGANEIPNKLGTSFPYLYLLAPASFSAAALSGDLTSQNGFILMPSAQGQLDLLAAGTVSLKNGSTGSIRMLDNDAAGMSSINAPRVLAKTDLDVLNGTLSGISAHMIGGLHRDDSEPARIVALQGDILGDSSQAVSVSLPKVAEIQAGRDIHDLGFTIQHNNPKDVTSIVAGRDFIDTTQSIGVSSEPSPVKHIVTGPGRIDISAGRDVDLGNGSGLVTRGNLDNPYLPEGGAGINVVAGGAQPDYDRMVSELTAYGSAYSVLDVASLPADAYRLQQHLMQYVQALKPGLLAGLSADQALQKAVDVFLGLPVAQQKPLLATNQWVANLDLAVYVRSLQPDLPASLSAAAALNVFRALPAAQQQPLLARNQFVADFMALGAFVGNALVKSTPTVPEGNWVALFDLLSNADKKRFLADRPAVAALLAKGDSQLAAQDMQDLGTFLGNTLPASASTESMWAAFRLLSLADQEAFLAQHRNVAERLKSQSTQLALALQAGEKPQMNAFFFSRLVEAGNQNSLSNFDRLIASLFPAAATARTGDIAAFNSQFKTEQGGAIDLFAPTGSVYTGLTTGISAGKTASTQGLFTIRGGAVRSLVRDDFLVNQGRVFTLGGGDITLVSQYNDISAGKGSKTASSAPPPLITIDPNGNVKVDVSGSISGSGIATLKTRADLPAGNIYVKAPRGTFDAGDAGVRSSGSVDISASVVLNASNISAAGAIVGTPSAIAEPSLGSVATPSGVGTKTDDVAKALTAAIPADENGVLSVEVVSYGDGAIPDGDASEGAESEGDEGDGDTRKKKKKKT